MASPGVASPDVLAVLKEFDPDVEEILASSGHVSLYTMVAGSKVWDYKDVEGSLFLLKRRGTPRFRMMVLNKRSTENFTEDVHGELHFEINPPYLMYTHGNSLITGVWFYEQEDLMRFEKILMRVKHTAEISQTVAPPRSQTAGRQTSKKSDEDNFYDRLSQGTPPGSAQQRQSQQQQQQPPLAQVAGAPSDSFEGASNLAALLRNAQRKQQQVPEQPQANSVSSVPQLMPPSFFAQSQRSAPPTTAHQQTTPLSAGLPQTSAPVPAPAAAQAPTAPHVQPRIPQVLVPAAPPADPMPPGGQMGGALAKLFANAHKPVVAQLPQQPTAPLPGPTPVVPGVLSQPTTRQQPPLPGSKMSAAAGPGGSGGGVSISDQEKVRGLLTRIATNDELLKLLAAEMRAVGML